MVVAAHIIEIREQHVLNPTGKALAVLAVVLLAALAALVVITLAALVAIVTLAAWNHHCPPRGC